MKIPEELMPPDGELETLLSLIIDGRYIPAAIAFIKGVAPDLVAKLFEEESGDISVKEASPAPKE